MTATEGLTAHRHDRQEHRSLSHDLAVVAAEYFVEWQVADHPPLGSPAEAAPKN